MQKQREGLEKDGLVCLAAQGVGNCTILLPTSVAHHYPSNPPKLAQPPTLTQPVNI